MGHLSLIEQAAELGDLTVGVVRDEAVSRVKGSSRPIIGEYNRARIVEAIGVVKRIAFMDDFCIPDFVIKEWDIIVVGADQNHVKGIDKIPKKKLHKIKRPRDGNCTSEIIKKIKES